MGAMTQRGLKLRLVSTLPLPLGKFRKRRKNYAAYVKNSVVPLPSVTENGDVFGNKIGCFRIQSHPFQATKSPVSETSVDRP